MFTRKMIEVCNKNFKNKNQVIDYMAQMAFESKLISDKEKYIESVLDREATMSTAVGHSIAIPHGESDVVNETFVACLKLNNPILWDSEEQANLIFMIGVPLSVRDKEHIKILAMLSKHLIRDEFRNSIQRAQTSEEFYQIIKPLDQEEI